MKDKTGKEIQNGNLLRIKFKMYDEEFEYDGIYKCNLNGWEGATLSLVKLYSPEETYHTTLTWIRSDLNFDYKNAKSNPDYYQFLVIDDKYEDIGNGYHRGRRIHLRHYSNDIQIVEI